jgi:hypothetical protein
VLPRSGRSAAPGVWSSRHEETVSEKGGVGETVSDADWYQAKSVPTCEIVSTRRRADRRRPDSASAESDFDREWAVELGAGPQLVSRALLSQFCSRRVPPPALAHSCKPTETTRSEVIVMLQRQPQRTSIGRGVGRVGIEPTS